MLKDDLLELLAQPPARTLPKTAAPRSSAASAASAAKKEE